MKRFLLVTFSVLAVVLAVTLVLRAQTTAAPGEYTVYGVGTLSCGRWIQEKAADTAVRLMPYDAYKNWAIGFVSGAGYGGLRLKVTDTAGITAFMDAYCAAHPLDLIAKAAHELIDQLTVRP